MSRRSLTGGIAALAAAAALLCTIQDAKACGGLFCSNQPVDQNAERIIFTINGNHTVTAYVQISYTGDPEKFAWILPAPTAPTLSADLPDLAMRILDSLTAPLYMNRRCTSISFGCGPSAGPGASVGSTQGFGGVTVVARQNVGAFETVTLEATSAKVLVDWLQKNDYRVTDKMTPFIKPYIEAGMKFVAMRLQPDKGTADITPIAMTYDSDKPAIPLRLTTVAAQPEMGIVTWILANKRWAPDNYVDLEIPDRLMQFDFNRGRHNYFALVSREVDKVGGQAFVTEYAGLTEPLLPRIQTASVPFASPITPEALQQARLSLSALVARFPYITRLYTRMSAEEMTEDPAFKVAGQQSDLSNVHDLTNPAAASALCGTVALPTPDPCAFTYCGRHGACAPISLGSDAGTSSNVDTGCVCAATATARATNTAGTPQVYCEPLAMDLDGVAADGGASSPLFSPACEGVSCGDHGRCVPMNGTPTCKCDSGYAAVVQQVTDPQTGTSRNELSCHRVRVVPPLPVLPPIGSGGGGASGAAGAGGRLPGSGCGISTASEAKVASLVWALGTLAAAVGLWARQRRRH
jgi:hypothetical protein